MRLNVYKTCLNELTCKSNVLLTVLMVKHLSIKVLFFH